MSNQNELDQMINLYNPTSHEFEIKVKYREINTYKKFLKYFMEHSNPQINQTINFINTRGKYSEIKELCFEDGVQLKENKRFYKKEQVSKPVFINSGNLKCELKATLNSEIPILDSQDFDLARFKQRFSFILEQWRIDFTFVKTSKTKLIPELQDIKKKMFEETNDLWEYCTQEIEFEFIGKSITIISIKEVMSILDDVKKTITISTETFLEKLANIIGDQKTKLKNTLKQVLKNPIELNKLKYFEEVVPFISNFSISWKASGITAILILDENISVQTTELKTLCKNIYRCNETILLCEMVNDIFYAYDCLKYDGINCANDSLDIRLNNLKNVIEKATEWKSLKLKETIKLTTTEDIKNFIKTPPVDYENDGVIFTSSEPFKIAKFFKWKQLKHRTIDFLVKDCPKNLLGVYPYINKPDHKLYILFSGIKSTIYTKFNMKKIQYHDLMFPIQTSSYFPIQFSPSSHPFAYLFWYPTLKESLDGKIVELRYKDEWKFVQIREDRAYDLSKKNYYGNDFKVAEQIWQNYRNPLTKKLLGASAKELSNGFYFRKNDSEIHRHIRRFNNMVKAQLLEHVTNWEYSQHSWLIDLGSGKGQDLHKYLINKSVNNVLMIDNNENNLYEIINRKYEYANNTNHGAKLGIFVKNIDLNIEWKTAISDIKKSFPMISPKLVICNFAIHYFAKNETAMFNFVNLVDALLPSGSRFMFTCLNGKNVFNLLTEKGTWGDQDKLKYFIKFASDKPPNKTFKGGEEIEILLPFSNGELFTEPLVNLELIEKLFKKKKIILESSGNFGEKYLEKFKYLETDSYKKLDALDLEYIKLLWFSVYYKKNSKK
jgi:hypothetical protein